jgi:alanyl-tRNA synthetase
MIPSADIRQGFLSFFEQRNHRIVPSAPVIPHGDPTLLFTNAGMNQFKDVFLGTGTREYHRAADTQKCIRVSGKHNDLEEVGRDTYHHTFFEMLGNWSFGDYYKKEAIAWAWELLTGIWGLQKERLYATVFETDDEAADFWQKETDIGRDHILRFGKKDNFWEMGETGPCGPCSEIHIDLTPDGSGRNLVNAGDPRVMEIWNLVFIQHNRIDQSTLEDLPAKHVDTGMGFERLCAILQGKKSNYDTDVFAPIIRAIEEATGRPYEGDADQTAMRVIADHTRMLTFAIADGALPANDGRGYVLRRILRRASRFGRNLGMGDPFIYRLASTVASSMGGVFPEIEQNREHVERVIKAEEESFNETLDRGIQIFESAGERIGHSKVLPGSDAFRLYDTYGFPLDLTQLMADERGLRVDVGEFTELMEGQRRRARESSKSIQAFGRGDVLRMVPDLEDSTFVGYEELDTRTRVHRVIEENLISLDRTPFYVESGGQVDDTGVITGKNFLATVVDSFRQEKKILHEVRILKGSPAELAGREVTARVDADRRHDIERNHSATHLVHEALRRVLGSHLQQQGSLVAPDRLRFDFNHFQKITPDQIRAIEDIVNEKVSEAIDIVALNDPADWLSIEEAKRRYPNVKMFFGDKYGDRVRIVEIDPRFSVELCGGTHVANTRDIALFKILSETGIASGIRRIEAVSGTGVKRYIDERVQKIGTLDGLLEGIIKEVEEIERQLGGSSLADAITRPSLPAVHTSAAELSLEQLRALDAAVAQREDAVEHATKSALQLRKEASRERVRTATGSIDSLMTKATDVDGVRVMTMKIRADSMDELKSLGDTLRSKLGTGVGIIASVIEGKVALVCVVTDDLVRERKLQAGKIVGAVAKEVGGGGGGRPHLATAGGRDVDKLGQAIASVPAIVRSFLAQEQT